MECVSVCGGGRCPNTLPPEFVFHPGSRDTGKQDTWGSSRGLQRQSCARGLLAGLCSEGLELLLWALLSWTLLALGL